MYWGYSRQAYDFGMWGISCLFLSCFSLTILQEQQLAVPWAIGKQSGACPRHNSHSDKEVTAPLGQTARKDGHSACALKYFRDFHERAIC